MSDLTTIQSPLLSFLERAAKDPEFDLAKFAALLDMQRQAEKDQARKAFSRAMAAVQNEIQPVVRDARNSHLGNRYAKLETIDAAIRPVLSRHGISIRFGSEAPSREGLIRITCTVEHADGYFETTSLEAPTGGGGALGGKTATTPIQQIGSLTTYLRRYLVGLTMNVVLADEDDDGESSRNRPAARPVLPTRPADPLLEPDGTKWLANLEAALAAATDKDEVEEVAAHTAVRAAMATAPKHIKDAISERLVDAFARFHEADPTVPMET